MGIVYTPEQQQVIDTHGRNLLVSAAAGSGKTAVLVERIVKMISDASNPVDIDRLLIVTFTNAAAAEMRERISTAIAKRLDADPENEHLQKQATLIHNAQITTIDSFCMFVIRNNFNDIGLDPGFRVADEGELKLLKQDIMAAMLEEKFAESSGSFLNCVEYFSTGSQDKAIEEHILKLYDFAESYPWPEEWLKEREKDYEITSVEDLDQTSWMKFAIEQINRMVLDCIRKIEECLSICEQPDGPYMYGAVLEKEKERLEKLLSFEKYQGGYELFKGMTFDRLPSKKDDSVSPLKRMLVQNIRNEIKDSIKTICGKYFPASAQTVVAYMQGCNEAVKELVALTLTYKEALDKRKRENNLIDFSDMEHLALSILVKKTADGYEPTQTALDYRAYFAEILIDEYQDSNLVQEYLLKSISGEEAGEYNRFMVGDVKQSIYKFRLARPEIFMEKYEVYKSNSETKQRIDLHKNFRSRKEILDSVNYIFTQIMGKRLGGIEYDQEAALHLGADYKEQEMEEVVSQNATELLLILKDDKEEEVKRTVRQQEAYGVAKRIKELTENFKVTDKETGMLRPASYKDIVILLRTNTGWDEEFKSVLKEEGIPSHVASKTGYFAAKEIQTVLQLLRVLDNPLQDIPLFGVMKSYFGKFDEEEIAYISGKREDKKQKLFFCLKDYAEEAGENSKVAEFLALIETYRNKTVYMPIHELMHEIIMQTGYYHYVTALPGGEQRKANIEILLEKAKAFEQTSYYGLFHFIRYIEQLEKYDVDYGEANILDENADVVRIMSIHKSKGLEFPICFVCGLAKRFNMMDINRKMIADVDMGIGVDYVDIDHRLQSKTIRKNAIAEKMRLDNLGEELRILYVALTRAKEKLIMTGVVEKMEPILNSLLPVRMSKERQVFYSNLAGASSYLDFILPALARHEAFEEIWEAYGYEKEGGGKEFNKILDSSLYVAKVDLKISVLSKQDFMLSEIKKQIKTENLKRRLLLSDIESDDVWMERMENLFSYQYQHEELSDLYTKTTVSELKKAGQTEEINYSFDLYEEEKIIPYIPKFMQEEESLGGAGRGTAFHKVMELMDFRMDDSGQLQIDTRTQIEKMIESGRLSKEYAQAISIPLIEEFMLSNLGKRMQQAESNGCLYKEQPFVLGIPAKELNEKFPTDELVLIQGIIDIYFEENGELIVADYKTDRVDTEEELVEKYIRQLEYYARALEQITGKKVKDKIIYSFGLRKEIML